MVVVYLHVIWFGRWIGFGVEGYPYGLLTMIVSLEAIFIGYSSAPGSPIPTAVGPGFARPRCVSSCTSVIGGLEVTPIAIRLGRSVRLW